MIDMSLLKKIISKFSDIFREEGDICICDLLNSIIMRGKYDYMCLIVILFHK